MRCSGTVIHLRALVTTASASMAPNPKLWLNLSPAAFVCHVVFGIKLSGFDV